MPWPWELTGTISADVIMPLLLLLSVWDQKKLLVTTEPLQHKEIALDLKDFSFHAETFCSLQVSQVEIVTHPPPPQQQLKSWKKLLFLNCREIRNARHTKKRCLVVCFEQEKDFFFFFHELCEQFRARPWVFFLPLNS